MRDWWRRLFPRPPSPSVYLFRHLNGTGNGYDLDDLISRHQGDTAYQDVIDAVLALMLQHGDQALDQPPATTDLRRRALSLASQGR